MFVGQATICMMACVHSSPCPHVLPLHPSVPCPPRASTWPGPAHTWQPRSRGGGYVVREKVWWIHCRPVTITSPAIIGSIKLRLITAWYRHTNLGIEDVPTYHLTCHSTQPLPGLYYLLSYLAILREWISHIQIYSVTFADKNIFVERLWVSNVWKVSSSDFYA